MEAVGAVRGGGMGGGGGGGGGHALEACKNFPCMYSSEWRQ